MATELIEAVVIPHLEEKGARYKVVSDNAVLVEVAEMFKDDANSAGNLTVQIRDQGMARADMLEATVFPLAEFPEDRAFVALELCNNLSMRSVGKFFVAETGGVGYKLDWHIADRSNLDLDEVGMLLAFARIMIDLFYPAIKSARWGNVSAERALESL